MVLNIHRSEIISNRDLVSLEKAVILPSLKPFIRKFFGFAGRNFIGYHRLRDSLGDEKVLLGFRVVHSNFDWLDVVFYSKYKQQQIDFFGYGREDLLAELGSKMFRYPDPPFNPWAD